MTKKKKKANSYKKKGGINKQIAKYSHGVWPFIVLLLLILAFLLSQHKKTNHDESMIFSYEECIQFKNSVVENTFPKRCKTKDGILWIEKVSNPIDTTNWKFIDTNQGITYKCPPSWNCSANQISSWYGNMSISFSLLTSNNFQTSLLRNPNYSSPIVWYNDLLTNKDTAIHAPLNTRVYREGTDGYSDPMYAYYELDKMTDINLASGNGKVIPILNHPDLHILIPLSDTQLLVITLPAGEQYKNPIVKSILNTVKSSIFIEQNSNTSKKVRFYDITINEPKDWTATIKSNMTYLIKNNTSPVEYPAISIEVNDTHVSSLDEFQKEEQGFKDSSWEKISLQGEEALLHTYVVPMVASTSNLNIYFFSKDKTKIYKVSQEMNYIDSPIVKKYRDELMQIIATINFN